MSDAIKNNDLRGIKATRALTNALLVLLDKQSFKKITINKICAQALYSRASFYAHFNSKYDLLWNWFQEITRNIPGDLSAYNEADIIANINLFILKNKKIIKNIVEDYDVLVLDLFEKFAMSIIKNPDRAKNKILIKFCAGGFLNILSWHAKSQSLSDPNLINTEIYRILRYIF